MPFVPLISFSLQLGSRAAGSESAESPPLPPLVHGAFQLQGVSEAWESLTHPGLRLSVKVQASEHALSSFRLRAHGSPPLFLQTVLRRIPQEPPQSQAGPLQVPLAVTRSITSLLLTAAASALPFPCSAASWGHLPNTHLHPSLCLILTFKYSPIFGGYYGINSIFWKLLGGRKAASILSCTNYASG